MLKPVTADCERMLGPDHRITLRSRISLARAYAIAGRLRKATALYRQAHAGYERTLGSDHPITRRYSDWLATAPRLLLVPPAATVSRWSSHWKSLPPRLREGRPRLRRRRRRG